jgi:outer membrane protein OmpA-like peptidoglycan-associated protein
MKSKVIVYIALLGVLSLNGYSQEAAVARADKKYERYAFVDAIQTYERIAEKGYKNADMFQKLGNAYYFNAELEKAARWYGELFAMTQDVEPEYFYRYAQSLKSTGDYTKANQMLDAFNAKLAADLRAKHYAANKDYLARIKANSGRYEMKDAGVNSEYSDYGSTMFGDKLVFTSARDTGNFAKRKHKWTGQYFTGFYAAQMSGDTLGETEKFAKEVNSKFNEATPAFSKDGKTMYFTRNNYNDGKKGKNGERITLVKIYKATLEKDGDREVWKNVTELPFNSNDYSAAHPALSPDGKTLYFASDMPGTLGQSDLYKVSISEDGTVGTPVNLGPTVNTEGRETFPTVTNENELYFATDGHPGLGGLDIFMSRMAADGTLSAPQNIGEPANSPKDDFAYIIDTKTRKGYLTSNREGGQGYDDIYSFLETRKLICEQALEGIVTDLETGEILPGTKVTLLDPKFVKIAEFIADDKGHYEFEVECGTDYYVRAEKELYNTKEQKITIADTTGVTNLPIQLEKKVKAVTVGDDLAKAFGIKMIYFDYDKSDIRADAALELEKILDVMKQYPNMKIDARSHTDWRGSHAYNAALSERRAQSTVKWLIKNGVDKSRITGKGYGETRPVNNCTDGVECSEADHQLNRRSEFIITGL